MAYDQREREFLEDVGRIKYMQESGMFDPPAFTKPMKKRLEQMGLTYDHIKPVSCESKKKPKKNKGKDKKIYGYYVNGNLAAHGTKEEIKDQTNVRISSLDDLIYKGKIRNIGRFGSGKTHFVRKCEE